MIREDIITFQKQLKYAVASAFVTGLIAHGYMLFNKISYHDDAYCMYTLGGTYTSGRWNLGILGALVQKLLGGNISIPALNGFASIAFVALAAAVLVLTFRVEKPLLACCISGILVSFPSLTATFAYMFTAPYYMFAFFLAVSSGYLLSLHRRWFDRYMIGAILLLGAAVGVYQAYFGVAVTICLMLLILSFREEDTLPLFLRGVRYVIALGLGLVCYFVLNKLCLAATHYELSNYSGINNMLGVSVQSLAAGIGSAYTAFFRLFYKEYLGLNSLYITRGALLLLGASALVLLTVLSRRHNRTVIRKIFFWGVVLLLPLGVDIVQVMIAGGDTEVHTLMLYTVSFLFIFPLVLLEKEPFLEQTGAGVCRTAAVLLAAVVICGYVDIDNQAYLKVDLMQNQAVSYYNRLIARIESAEGYQTADSVYIAGNGEMSMDNLTEIALRFPCVTITGYDWTSQEYLNNYAWKEYVREQLGYSPIYEMTNINTEAIMEMSCYPNEDSIRVVDGVVIVKFSE
jgi:hypothetical protein